nr:DUF4350 domain-containing protein [Bacteroidota bacterium]
MSRRAIIVLVIVLVIILGIVILIRYLNTYAPKYFWGESYSITSEEPYGTQILYELLKENNDKGKLITLDKHQISDIDSTIINTNYIFIGDYLRMDSTETQRLLEYVARGNNAFISTNSSPESIIYHFTKEYGFLPEYEFRKDKIFNTSFFENNKKFAFHHQFLKDSVSYHWGYIDKDELNENFSSYYNAKYLSELENDQINFLSIKYENGTIYLHTNPVLFTNYYLITPEGFDYINHVFSGIDDGDIYWDEINKRYTAYNSEMYNGNPLKYIFSQRSLRWAWYLGIIIVILFVIFKAKREQKIIPIVDENKNTSLEFINNIGALYYQAKDHRIIANEIMLLFYSFIRNRYGIKINIKNKAEMISEISQKSEID